MDLHLRAEEAVQQLREQGELLDFCPTEVINGNCPAVVVCCVDHRLLLGRLGWMCERLKKQDMLQVYTFPGGINWLDPKYQNPLVNQSNADAIGFSVAKLHHKFGVAPAVLTMSDTPCIMCEDRGHTVPETCESGLRGRAFLERRLGDTLTFSVKTTPLLHARRLRDQVKDLTYRIRTDTDTMLQEALTASNTVPQPEPFMRAVH